MQRGRVKVQTKRGLASGLVAATAVLSLAGVIASILARGKGAGLPGVVSLPIAVLGALIVKRVGNDIGWLFLVAALSISLSGSTDSFITYSLLVHSQPLPGTTLAGWLNNVAFTMFAAPLPLVFLLFPTGRPPSSRWRAVVWLWTAGLVLLVVGTAFRPGDVYATPGAHGLDIGNPIGIPGSKPLLDSVVQAGVFALIATAALSIVSLVVRFRRARGEERQQMKWLVYVGALLAFLFLVLTVIDAITGDHPTGILDKVSSFVWGGFALLFGVGIPAAVAVAVFKYRLYDIDVVIRKTVVFGVLAVFITLIYVLIVVGLPLLVTGAAGGAGFSFLAAIVLAVLFQPVRHRANRLADHIVYGKRATPYEVLTDLSQRVAHEYALVDVLPRMAQVLARGLGAQRVRVWLRVDGKLRPEAAWPIDMPEVDPVAYEDGEPRWPPGEIPFEVRHAEDVLGAFTVVVAATDPMTPAKEKLAREFAGQAALVLRNVRLVENIRASRQRLAAAQDEERRRVEAALREGPRGRLVDVATGLGEAEGIVRGGLAAATGLIERLQGGTQDALEQLRDLARGIYPPLLADNGLPAALEAQARRSSVHVDLSIGEVGRYGQEVEATLYFFCRELLRMAALRGVSSLAFTLTQGNGRLEVHALVRPNGTGSIEVLAEIEHARDRIEAIGGSIEEVPSEDGAAVVAGVPVGRIETGVASQLPREAAR